MKRKYNLGKQSKRRLNSPLWTKEIKISSNQSASSTYYLHTSVFLTRFVLTRIFSLNKSLKSLIFWKWFCFVHSTVYLFSGRSHRMGLEQSKKFPTHRRLLRVCPISRWACKLVQILSDGCLRSKLYLLKDPKKLTINIGQAQVLVLNYTKLFCT